MVHTKLTRQGARVLALGYKQLGTLSLREVRSKPHTVAHEGPLPQEEVSYSRQDIGVIRIEL